jgi:fatty acid desaturase
MTPLVELRYKADWRTLLWMWGLAPGLVALQYARPDWVVYLSWMSFYFAVSSGVIAHNHQHCPTFKSKAWSRFFGNWISIFYGYPTTPAWVPTHNLNHHKFVNKAGDATITWRITNSHNLFVAVTYFFVSAYYQAEPISVFLKKMKAEKPEQFRRIQLQYVFVYGAHALMLGLAIWLHGVTTGLYVWAFSMGLPAVFALWTLMLFNYEQHVHTDPWSKRNHSRNFVGTLLNFWLFNNGFHTAHHEQAGLHWSKLPQLHATFQAEIDPALNQRSLWWYWFKQYFLAAVIPSLGTRQVGRAPFDPPGGQERGLATEEVGLGDSGTNVARV